jgi:hypothetical protein
MNSINVPQSRRGPACWAAGSRSTVKSDCTMTAPFGPSGWPLSPDPVFAGSVDRARSITRSRVLPCQKRCGEQHSDEREIDVELWHREQNIHHGVLPPGLFPNEEANRPAPALARQTRRSRPSTRVASRARKVQRAAPADRRVLFERRHWRTVLVRPLTQVGCRCAGRGRRLGHKRPGQHRPSSGDASQGQRG